MGREFGVWILFLWGTVGWVGVDSPYPSLSYYPRLSDAANGWCSLLATGGVHSNSALRTSSLIFAKQLCISILTWIMIPNHNFHSGGLAPPINFVRFFSGLWLVRGKYLKNLFSRLRRLCSMAFLVGGSCWLTNESVQNLVWLMIIDDYRTIGVYSTTVHYGKYGNPS